MLAMLRLILAGFLMFDANLALAGGTGPGTGGVDDWYFCMQENIKAEVWSNKAKSADAAVAASYRSCRPEFKTAMGTLETPAQKAAFRRDATIEQKQYLRFATKMKLAGKP